MWIRSVGPGRVFVMAPGLCNWTFNDPVYRVLLFRGMAWAAGRPLDRFDSVLGRGADLLGK